MIETYLRPLRAHDWDRGALLSFRAMKRPEALPYEAVTQPVLLVIGSQDSMLLKSTHKVRLLLRQCRVWVKPPRVCGMQCILGDAVPSLNLMCQAGQALVEKTE
jgi:hypothetical protein